MSSIQVSLPVPAGDGVGAGVDCSLLGAKKTVTVGGSFTAVVTIEVSQDAGATWAPVASFTQADEQALDFAAQQMRVRINNFTSGTPDVDVGAEASTGNFSAVNVPAGAGSGTALDVSQFGLWNTITCSTDPGTTLNIEISQDGSTWTPVVSFTKAGAKTVKFSAQWMRVTAVGTHAVTVIAIGATNESGAGGQGANFFGTGVSGDLVVAGTTFLSGDAFFDNVTVQAGGSLRTQGRRLFVRNTLKVEAGGVLSNDGAAGTAGAGAIAGTGGAAYTTGTLPVNAAGGDGNVAGAGVAGNATADYAGTTTKASGAGGAGASGAGGASANAVAHPTAEMQTPYQLDVALKMYSADRVSGTLVPLAGGAGGGGGGGEAATAGGGGGGAGGGLLVVAAKTIVVEATGVISADGGAGGDGAAAGDAGGGGGGTGGVVSLVYQALQSSGTIRASGGAGGVALGTGADGAAGADGQVFLYQTV